MKRLFKNVFNIIISSVSGILAYVLGSMLMLLFVEPGFGIIAIIVLPILTASAANEIICDMAKTRLVYLFSEVIITLYIVAVIIHKLICYNGLDSVFWIIYHSIAIITIVVCVIRRI